PGREARMAILKITRKFFRALRKAAWYGLPFLSVIGALIAQGVLQNVLPKGSDFPYAFFYLMAAFACAWYGGYVSGAVACLFTMVGLPLLTVHFSQMPPVDISRLAIFLAVSLLISRLAQTQKRAREVLRSANNELDRRVQERTGELACV